MAQEKCALRWMHALSRIMNVGFLVLGPSAELRVANALGCELLGCGDQAALAGQWNQFRHALDLGKSGPGPNARPRRTTVDVRVGDRVRLLRLETYALQEEGCGYLVLLKDRHAADVLETDLVLASQMRSLVHVYRTLAHDLKAPLNAMQLTLDLIAEPLPADAPPENERRRQRHVQVLKQELMRLNRMLQTMLDHREPLRSQPAVFDLVELLREVLSLVAAQARRQRVELEVYMPETLVGVSGYRDRLRQALLNIALIGIEAMPRGGRLRLDMAVDGEHAHITVRDTGPGIPEALLDEIYQLYFTTKKSGSGIGLYVTRLVVESHGGEIVVNSGEGRGTCFRIRLPVHST